MRYRESIQASTKKSPYYMLFHQDMRLLIDAELLPPKFNQESDDVDKVVDKLLLSRATSFADANENIKDAQTKQKETYDRKHLKEEIPEGAEVLLENTKQKQRKGGKYDPLWLGSYIVDKNNGKGLYSLKRKNGELLKSQANSNRLKLYIRRDDDKVLG